MRIASHPETRWTKKAAKWNPQDSTLEPKHAEQWEDQKKIWEDDINQFPKPEDTEKTKGNELKKQRHMDLGSKRLKRMDRNCRRSRQAGRDESRHGSRSYADVLKIQRSPRPPPWRPYGAAEEDDTASTDSDLLRLEGS